MEQTREISEKIEHPRWNEFARGSELLGGGSWGWWVLGIARCRLVARCWLVARFWGEGVGWLPGVGRFPGVGCPVLVCCLVFVCPERNLKLKMTEKTWDEFVRGSELVGGSVLGVVGPGGRRLWGWLVLGVVDLGGGLGIGGWRVLGGVGIGGGRS